LYRSINPISSSSSSLLLSAKSQSTDSLVLFSLNSSLLPSPLASNKKDGYESQFIIFPEKIVKISLYKINK
jgi:hypothetical protein